VSKRIFSSLVAMIFSIGSDHRYQAGRRESFRSPFDHGTGNATGAKAPIKLHAAVPGFLGGLVNLFQNLRLLPFGLKKLNVNSCLLTG
jgi:hypothetical protein